MTFIDIKVERKDDNLMISIKNNGLTVPLEFDQKEKLHIPELIFGHLMTGSNFDDSKVFFNLFLSPLLLLLLFSFFKREE